MVDLWGVITSNSYLKVSYQVGFFNEGLWGVGAPYWNAAIDPEGKGVPSTAPVGGGLGSERTRQKELLRTARAGWSGNEIACV